MYTDMKKVLEALRSGGKKKLILDTDTYNEIDDQYALALLVLSAPKLRVAGIHAAPFYAPGMNHKSVSPEDGMEKSYEEILNVLRIMGREDLFPLVQKGSRSQCSSSGPVVENPETTPMQGRCTRGTPQPKTTRAPATSWKRLNSLLLGQV